MSRVRQTAQQVKGSQLPSDFKVTKQTCSHKSKPKGK